MSTCRFCQVSTCSSSQPIWMPASVAALIDSDPAVADMGVDAVGLAGVDELGEAVVVGLCLDDRLVQRGLVGRWRHDRRVGHREQDGGEHGAWCGQRWQAGGVDTCTVSGAADQAAP